MLALYVYVTHALTIVFLNVTSTIKCSFYTRKTHFKLQKKHQGVLPKTMLLQLVINNGSISDVFMDDISNMKCHFHHLYLKEYFIQQKHDQNCQHLCWHYCVSSSDYAYFFAGEISYIQCYLILSTTTFKLTNMNKKYYTHLCYHCLHM